MLCSVAVALIMMSTVTARPIVENSEVNINIARRQVNENSTYITEEDDRDFYALLVICTDYIDNGNDIDYISDYKLTALYRALLESKNWKEENIILLNGTEPTKENITNAIYEIAEIIGENDTFMFSYQGHGSNIADVDGDEEDGYDEAICPRDCMRKNDTIINLITDDELDFLFSQIKCDGQFLMFESCMSGGLITDDSMVYDVNGDGFLTETDFDYYNSEFKEDFVSDNKGDVNSDGRVVVVSSFSDEFLSTGSDIFGFTMTFGISSAMHLNSWGYAKDKNNDGYVSAEELFDYVKLRLYAMYSVRWMQWWGVFFVYNYAVALSNPDYDLTPYEAALYATIETFMAFLWLETFCYDLTGQYFLNAPHMSDCYGDDSEELPLLIIDESADYPEVDIPYLPQDIWDSDIAWEDIDQIYWPELVVVAEYQQVGSTTRFKGNGYNGPEEFEYFWDFGDGSTSTEQNPAHQYSKGSVRTATLTVTDAAGRQASTTINVKAKCLDYTTEMRNIKSFFSFIKQSSLFSGILLERILNIISA